jgi:hypothetical protein
MTHPPRKVVPNPNIPLHVRTRRTSGASWENEGIVKYILMATRKEACFHLTWKRHVNILHSHRRMGTIGSSLCSFQVAVSTQLFAKPTTTPRDTERGETRCRACRQANFANAGYSCGQEVCSPASLYTQSCM